MKDYPPAHVIHESGCPDAPPGLLTFRAHSLREYPTSRPHTCFSRQTVVRNRDVVAESVDYGEHAYQASTLHPEDAIRPLCEICRGTHGVHVDLAALLRLS